MSVGRARYVETEVGDGLTWRRVVCAETGEGVDVRNRHPGHILRALAQLSEACGCGARWHFANNQTPAPAGEEESCRP